MCLTAPRSDLDLSRNQLQALPPDLSALAELRVLNVSSNHFRCDDAATCGRMFLSVASAPTAGRGSDMGAVIPGLASLPRLEELSISLQTERDEEAIFLNLPGA